MLTIGDLVITFAQIGYGMIALAWLSQLWSMYRKRSRTIKKSFVWWYVIGLALVLAPRFTDPLSLDLILVGLPVVFGLLIIFKLKR